MLGQHLLASLIDLLLCCTYNNSLIAIENIFLEAVQCRIAQLLFICKCIFLRLLNGVYQSVDFDCITAISKLTNGRSFQERDRSTVILEWKYLYWQIKIELSDILWIVQDPNFFFEKYCQWFIIARFVALLNQAVEI